MTSVSLEGGPGQILLKKGRNLSRTNVKGNERDPHKTGVTLIEQRRPKIESTLEKRRLSQKRSVRMKAGIK